jgi:hypothetical protein
MALIVWPTTRQRGDRECMGDESNASRILEHGD